MGRQDSKIDKQKFGLIGRKLDYSFSKTYFETKFKQLEFDNYTYETIECDTEEAVVSFFAKKIFQYRGLNVTIPYKERVIHLLDSLNDTAKNVGAVNTILVKNNKLIGYNTDVYGFTKALEPYLNPDIKKALVLGTGGAAKAVAYALKKLQIEPHFVSRATKHPKIITYNSLDKQCVLNHLLVVNCTPLGTFPKIQQAPDIPYQYLTKNHVVFDLVYNPKETLFMHLAKENGAVVSNGMKMLQEQAEQAWELWKY